MLDAKLPQRANPAGELPSVERDASAGPVAVDTYAGPIHVEWDGDAAVTPLGHLAFFAESLKTSGRFDALMADAPLAYASPNAPRKRDVIGTAVLATLAGHWRYAHITARRGDTVNPALLGMSTVVSEAAGRRGLDRIEAAAGAAWLCGRLDATLRPLLAEPWILDCDTTIKPLYGHREGAEVGCHPHKPGRPSHASHSFQMAGLRLILDVAVEPGARHTSKHARPHLWDLVGRLEPALWPQLVRGDKDWGNEPNMARCEQEGVDYLFKLRLSKGVRRVVDKAMGRADWVDAGQGWWGREAGLRLSGWSRQRRVVVVRRKLPEAVGVSLPKNDSQGELFWIEPSRAAAVWEFAVLVTSLGLEVRSLAQLYRDRAGSENTFDELKNQWGWAGFTTRDLTRCRIMARLIALVSNWWTLFVRLADPDHHREALTSRPLLLHAVARQTRHAGQTRLTVTACHGRRDRVIQALRQISQFFQDLRQNAEQLTAAERWVRILSRAMVKYLHGRQLRPPPRLMNA